MEEINKFSVCESKNVNQGDFPILDYLEGCDCWDLDQGGGWNKEGVIYSTNTFHRGEGYPEVISFYIDKKSGRQIMDWKISKGSEDINARFVLITKEVTQDKKFILDGVMINDNDVISSGDLTISVDNYGNNHLDNIYHFNKEYSESELLDLIKSTDSHSKNEDDETDPIFWAPWDKQLFSKMEEVPVSSDDESKSVDRKDFPILDYLDSCHQWRLGEGVGWDEENTSHFHQEFVNYPEILGYYFDGECDRQRIHWRYKEGGERIESEYLLTSMKDDQNKKFILNRVMIRNHIIISSGDIVIGFNSLGNTLFKKVFQFNKEYSKSELLDLIKSAKPDSKNSIDGMVPIFWDPLNEKLIDSDRLRNQNENII